MHDEHCDLLCVDASAAERIRSGLPGLGAAERAAERARSLSDPTRLTLAALRRTELCVCDLSWIVEKPQSLVSHHMRFLKVAGMVASRRDGKMVMYRLTDDGLSLLGTVLGDAVPEKATS